MRKIWGIGLPRTGTRSLARALEILGFRGSHSCSLYNQQCGVDHPEFIVDNGKYKKICFFGLNIKKEDLYILTVRHQEEWQRSVSARGYKGLDIVEYMNLVKKEFSEYPNNLLIFNVEDGWPSLCEFLGKDIPNEEFPRVRELL